MYSQEKAAPGDAAPADDAKKTAAKPQAKPPVPAVVDPAEEASPSGAAYLQLPVTDAEKRNRVGMQAILRLPSLQPDQRAAIEKYYKSYALPRWTNPANYSDVAKYRVELRRELSDVAKAGEAFALVQDLAVAAMKHFIDPQKNYAPVVKYNAVLLLGELDTEAAAGASRGTPLPAALPLLIEALQSAEQSDPVRVGALQGIVRHAGAATLDPQVRNAQLVPALLALIKSPPPRGRAPEGHDWMRALAIQALAATRQAGADGANAVLLAGIVSDAKERMSVRLAAARALGLLDYSSPGSLKALDLAGPLAQLITECYSFENARTPVLSNPIAGPGMGSMGMMGGGMGMSGGMGMTGGAGMTGGMMPSGAAGGAGGSSPADAMKKMYGGKAGGGKTSGKSSAAGASTYPGMGGGYPGMGATDAEPQEDPNEKERIEQFRRRYRTELTAIHWGLIGAEVVRPNDPPKGVASLAAGKPEAKFITDVAKNILDQSKAMDKEAKKFKDLTDNLKKPMADLTKLVAEEPGAAARRPAAGGAGVKPATAPAPAGAAATAAPAEK